MRDLPRLPIPPLKTTLARYVETVTPLLSKDELEETKKRVAKFLQYDGPMLDLQLMQLQRQSKTSWLEGFWDSMYLEWRDSVAIHMNPCFALQDDPTPERNGQVTRAASLVSATVWFIDSLRSQTFAPDRERGERLCMHQYSVLFGSTRIPQFARDRLVTQHNSRHIAVVSRDQYYWFNVYDEDGKPFEIEELERYLRFILNDARQTEEKSDSPLPPLGMLTTAPRDSWAQSYQNLLKDPRNREYMDKLTSALFLVCLDEHMPSNLEETGKILLHADGRNRWFDKSIQLIVCKNGKAGINMEHTAFDGHTTLRFAEDMFNYSVRMRCDSPSSWSAFDQTETTNPTPPLVNKLNFTITQDIRSDIDKATVEFNKLASACNTSILHFVTYSKSFLVKYKLSPDAFIQMAFQLTYYRLMGTVGSTYESAMTKKYYHGRTECMRSLVNEAMTFLKVFTDPSSTALDQIQALRVACTAHANKVRLAKNGDGVDRHLYGLFNLAKQQQKRLPGYRIPEIFEDVAYARMRYDVMSTSNCGGYALSSFGFGPVVPDGFGLGYILKDKCMHFHITNYEKEKTVRFQALLERSLMEMGELIKSGIPVRATLNDGSKKAKL
uniref:Choline/carnitine acyltransferase domain-containing protein n=1 Tax=Arcella intermedia TaxID=1963864 RepID=A0A6B2KZV3_9EUKA